MRWYANTGAGTSVRVFEGTVVVVAPDPVDECQSCGEDLYLGVAHECPVGGNTVVVTEKEEQGDG